MGLLDLFRRKPEKLTLRTADVPDWFGTAAKQKAVQCQMEATEELRQLQRLLNDLQEQLKKFDTAKLQNEQVHAKARAMMESSRELYIRAATHLLNEIELPTQANAKQLAPFIQESREALATFAKTTQRAQMILNEFFAHEMRAFQNNLAQIERSLQNAYPDPYRKLIETERLVQMISQRQNAAEKISGELEKFTQQRRQIATDIAKAEHDRAAATKDREYHHFLDLQQQMGKIEMQQKHVQYSIEERFSALMPVLKKLSHDGMHPEVYGPYVQGAFQALQQDTTLQIIPALDAARAALEQNTVDLKDEKVERAKRSLAEISVDVLQQQLQQYRALQSEEKKLKTMLATNVTRNKIAEAEYRIAHLQQKLATLGEEEQKLRRALEARSDDQELDQLTALLTEIFERDVVIER